MFSFFIIMKFEMGLYFEYHNKHVQLATIGLVYTTLAVEITLYVC